MRERSPRESLYGARRMRRSGLSMRRTLENFNLFFVRAMHGSSSAKRAVKGTKVVWICVASVVVAELEKRLRLAFQARRPSNRKAAPGDQSGQDLP